MDVDYTLEQLEFHNKNYEWIVDESNKILKQIDDLPDTPYFNFKFKMLSNKLLELQKRFNRSKDEYNKLYREVNKYFEEKYGITFEPFLEDDSSN